MWLVMIVLGSSVAKRELFFLFMLASNLLSYLATLRDRRTSAVGMIAAPKAAWGGLSKW